MVKAFAARLIAAVLVAIGLFLVKSLVLIEDAAVRSFLQIETFRAIFADLRRLSNIALDQQAVDPQVHCSLHCRVVEGQRGTVVHRDFARCTTSVKKFHIPIHVVHYLVRHNEYTFGERELEKFFRVDNDILGIRSGW